MLVVHSAQLPGQRVTGQKVNVESRNAAHRVELAPLLAVDVCQSQISRIGDRSDTIIAQSRDVSGGNNTSPLFLLTSIKGVPCMKS